MCSKSHRATQLLFKYHISKLEWGEVKTCADLADTGRGMGVQDLGNPSDVILELSLISTFNGQYYRVSKNNGNNENNTNSATLSPVFLKGPEESFLHFSSAKC